MTSLNIANRILVIEDDRNSAQAISSALEADGFQCEQVHSGAEAVSAAATSEFGIVLLNLALQDDSGLGVLRCISEARDSTIVILLTPLELKQERLAGLEAGADDFVIMPCNLDEIRARVAAAQVRSRAKPRSILEVGPLKMDLTARRVSRDGRVISLTPTEFRILEILLRHHSRVVTRKMLCEFLWNPEWEGVTNVIEVHINRLRTKLSGKNEARLIHTVRGSGYSLRWTEEARSGDTVSPKSEAATSGTKNSDSQASSSRAAATQTAGVGRQPQFKPDD